MDVIFRFLRFLTIGSPDGKQIRIRLVGFAAIFVIVGIWGLNDRSQTPPSGIRGDTSPTLAPLSDAGTISVGGSVTGSLAEGERHAWSFEGQQGQRVSIRVRGDWDSTVEVYPPGGSQGIGIDFSSGGGVEAFLCSFRLSSTGTFHAVVSGYLGTPGRNFGDYTLSIREEGYVEERPVAYGATVEGRLSTCDGDFYTVAVEQGDTLEVRLTPLDNADIYVMLLPSRASDDLIAVGRPVPGTSYESAVINVTRGGVVSIKVAAPPTAPEDAAYTLSIGRYVEPTAEATREAADD